MKKLFALLTILLLVLSSCSSDDNGTSSSNIKINPPNWIQGSWLLEDSEIDGYGFRFTSNDILILQPGIEISQREQLETFSASGQDVSANDESTDNSYKVTLNFPAGQTAIYSFTKISNTTIRWNQGGGINYTKQ